MYPAIQSLDEKILTENGKDSVITLPLLVRGKEILEELVEYPVRYGKRTILTPDAKLLWPELVCSSNSLKDIHELPLSEIISFLVKVGYELNIDTNPYLQRAIELTKDASNLTEPIIRSSYYMLQEMFSIPSLTGMIRPVGYEYLDGWVKKQTAFGEASIKAVGVRTLHIPAGNVPAISALSILNGALTKGDTLIKLPSNDPVTGWAILKTMMDIDPNHPVTKHMTVVYWKGGDAEVEKQLINPTRIEKIVAWGGHHAISHIKGLIGPGIDLVTLDPKFSISVITKEAFMHDKWSHAARRAAQDVGYFNQDACLSSKVIYVETDPEKACKFGQMVYEYLSSEKLDLSTKPKSYPLSLKQELDTIRYLDDYQVYGGAHNEGAVIVSKEYDSKVDFAESLCSKTVNIVPIKSVKDVLPAINVATQTIGLYPESVKPNYRDEFIRAGAQRIVTLGGAAKGMIGMPQDGVELARRMVKWVVDESSV
ncbi:MAG: hypothetical protein HeimC3_13840 [Candidatus Heimdallarchaeota archaeon LC_3]|nr:MAG: hypothetical protein HeimC3_13840 [Candidatus Heimdallarchaeota archaeon LC_3]